MRDGFRPLHDFHTPVKAALIMMYSAVFVILYQPLMCPIPLQDGARVATSLSTQAS